MSENVKVRNPKELTDEELEQFLNLDLDDINPEICESEDSDCEPEILEKQEDIITIESDSGVHETDASLEESNLYYRTKANVNWNKLPYKPTRCKNENIIRKKPGLNQYSSNISSELDAFQLFLTDEILDIIVLYTNGKAEQVFTSWNQNNPDKQQRTWKPTDAVEIKAYIGLLLILGALQASKEPTIMLWCSKKGYSRPIIAASMSRARFQAITSFIRFDDLNSRVARKATDKLAPIREVFNLFIENFKKAYNPNSHITVDEQLVSFRGRCSFRVYMKSKPDKYGLKIWAAADSENAYTLNMQPYLGKMNNIAEKNQGERVVLDLVGSVGSGYGITTDNFFTSLPLADKLLEKGMSLCGTLRKNKPYIPKELLPKSYKPVFSSMFCFTKRHTMVSYVPSKSKVVLMLSTEHQDDAVSENNTKFKPDIILHYNKTKGAVDTTDKMVKEYSARRITNRWPMAIFGQLLDVAGINAFILWGLKFPQERSKSKDSRRIFLLALGELLIRDNAVRRFQTEKTMHKTIRNYILDIFPELEDKNVVRQELERPISGRCYLCDRKRDRKCRQICCHCKRFVCTSHASKQVICEQCKEEPGNITD